jgi:hypothetical protein
VLIVGDSIAFTLDLGLGEYQGAYGVEAVNAGILGCGITNGAQFRQLGVDYPMAPQCANNLWPRIWLTDIAKEKPNVVMILAGRWEVADRTYEGKWTSIENPTYAAYVRHQLESRSAWRARVGRRSS